MHLELWDKDLHMRAILLAREFTGFELMTSARPCSARPDELSLLHTRR